MMCLCAACNSIAPLTGSDEFKNMQMVDDIPDAVPRQEPRSKYGNRSSYTVNGRQYHTLKTSRGFTERGVASWYGPKFQGKRTSSGEPYNMYAMTAAHKRLPLPTYVRVTNLNNGRSVVVRVNDRGPFHDNRVIDLSYAAAKKLDIVQTGTGLVEIYSIEPDQEDKGTKIIPVVIPPTPKLFIQLGAFNSRQNAEMLRNQLKVHEFGAILVDEGQHNERTIYRVKIGPLASVDLADRTVRQLIAMGMRDYRVLIE